MTASSSLPSIDNKEIGLHAFARVKPSLLGFFNGIIFAIFHCYGKFPVSRGFERVGGHNFLTACQTCLNNPAGSPSSPAAFHDLAFNRHDLISSTVSFGMTTDCLCGFSPFFSIFSGSAKKEVASSSSACSRGAVRQRSVDLCNGGIPEHPKPSSGFT